MNVRLVTLAATLSLATAPAAAWVSVEHQAQGIIAYEYARAFMSPESRAQLAPYRDGGPGTSVVSTGSAEPDHCHSFWHSATSRAVGAACRGTELCNIRDGMAHSFLNSRTRTLYLVNTNENHFGAHTRRHWRFWHRVALTAAQRYQVTGSPMCERLAMGVESFALHYIQDRTASGHAWTQSTSEFRRGGDGEATKDWRRGCIHGQGFWLGVALRCAGGGLGGEPRAMGGDFWPSSGVGTWRSDEEFLGAPTAQFGQTRTAGSRAFLEIAQTMGCNTETAEPMSVEPTVYDDTWMSNLEMCRVVVGECCRGSFGSLGTLPTVTCNRCNSGPAIDPDNRHLTHAEIEAACPLGLVLDEEPSAAMMAVVEWVAVTTGFNRWVNILPPRMGGWSGTEVARTLWASPGAERIHPDADWNFNDVNSILDLAGCTSDMRAFGAPLRATTCAEWSCDENRVTYCLGDRPMIASCPTDPCGGYYTHTLLQGGRCVCPNVPMDGMCAVDNGESFANSPGVFPTSGDCGPGFCGDGACCRAGVCTGDDVEDEDTCPFDCAEEVCGDGFCHRGEECDRDCGPPGDYAGSFMCDEDGVVRTPVSPTCGNGRLDPGESCQLCPEDGTTGPAYPGADSCVSRGAMSGTYAQTGLMSLACENPPTCQTVSRGGWCTGLCDPDEGCVPSELAGSAPMCGGGGPSGRPPTAYFAPASGLYFQDCFGTMFDLCCLTCDGCPFVDVNLNGTGSSDPDGDPLTYRWSCPFSPCDFTTGARPRLRYYFGTSMPSCSLLTESVLVRLEVDDGTSTDTFDRLLPMTCDYRTTCF